MNHVPTVDRDRLAQLRTFLTDEAAAQLAESERRPLNRRRGRILAVAAVATAALSGATVVATLRPGGADAALAITTDGEWTTVRISDIEADAQAVVDELVAAGIDARIAPPGRPPAYGVTTEIVSDSDPELSYGLSIVVPAEPDSTVVADDPDLFELHGVRVEQGDNGLFSLQSGSDAVILVHPRG
jgi:hypothetical protein